MKKNNICTKTISGIVALTASLLLTFASCSNGMNLKDGLENSSDGKTYIKINAVSGMERTISPRSDGLVEKLTSLKLKGTPADDAPVTEPEEVELAQADSLEELSKMAIPVKEGYWSFVLTADLEGVPFSGESEDVQVAKGKVNPVTIKMSPETQYGGMSITVEFTGEADKVKATLYNEEGTEALGTQTFDSSNFKNLGENKHSVTYTRRAADESKQLASGSYRLLFEFYENEEERVEYPLNSVENIVRVTAGINTSAVIKLDLNELYSITYETAGGNPASADDILTNKYSRKNGVALPTMKKSGYAFAGWFENAGFEGNPITEIDEGSTGNKTLYAGFTNSVTVAANGDGATCNGMTGAFNSIETALMKINEWNDASVDYTIYIDGTLTGSQVIKDTTDTIAAKSITLCGKNGLDDDKPQDVLDGNNDDPDVYGPVLTILTTVQVNINNLTISNGSSGILAGDDSANDQKVNVNVNLLEGCLITGNGSSSGVQIAAGQVTLDGGIISGNTREHGAGVYLYGGEFIMESGSIHDNSADYRGAGVYVANGTFTMNGGEIYSNTSENQLDGGGVYVENGTFTMNDGEIYSNTSDNQLNGGGVYVGWNEDSDNPLIGKFIMNGGTIHDHDAALGGGVYIDGLDLPETFNETVSFVMKGGTISGNSSEVDEEIGGGGVLVYGEKASFTMEKGTITRNTSDGYGGGVCVGGGATFTLKDGTIGGDNDSDGNVSEDVDNGYGGGVHMAGGTFTMLGGTISHNQSRATSELGGGAVCLTKDSIFEMYAGTITGNSTENNGGAVFIGGSATFEMTGGTISGNTAAKAGKGVYQNTYNGSGTFRMGVAAEITSDNDVYLTDKITLYAAFDDKSKTAAMITPSSYSEGTVVLADGGNAIVSTNYSVFAVTPQVSADGSGGTIKWCVTEEGKLARDGVQTYYVTARTLADGETDTGDGSATNPFANIQNAINLIKENYAYTADYVITVTGMDDSTQKVTGNEAGVLIADIPAASLLIQGDGTGDADGIQCIQFEYVPVVINTTVPVTFKDFVIKPYGYVNGTYNEDGYVVYIGSGSNVTLSQGFEVDGSGDTGTTINTHVAFGAVYVSSDAKLVMEGDASVHDIKVDGKDNNSNDFGAAIYVAGNLEMGGTSSIYSTVSTANNGGGIYITSNGKVTLKDSALVGSIDSSNGNSCQVNGGGVYLAGGEFIMEGGTITGNVLGANSNNHGSGVFVESGTFKMSGDAVVASDNDVYLAGETKITIAGALTRTTPVATITPSDYSADLQVLELAADADDTTLADEYSKFAVTPQSSGSSTSGTSTTYWKISSEGKLFDKYGTKSSEDGYEVGDIVFSDGTATPYSATLTLTDEQKDAAIAIIFYKGTGLNNATGDGNEDTTTVRTLGVGLKQKNEGLEGLAWCLETASAYNKKITTIQCPYNEEEGTFSGDKNGSDNLDQISAFLLANNLNDDTATAENYPAFYFAKNYKDNATNVKGTAFEEGWYLPSIAELIQLDVNGLVDSKVFDISAASELCGGESYTDWRWSSSQYYDPSVDGQGTKNAYLLSSYHGWAANEKNDARIYVCAIREF